MGDFPHRGWLGWPPRAGVSGCAPLSWQRGRRRRGVDRQSLLAVGMGTPSPRGGAPECWREGGRGETDPGGMPSLLLLPFRTTAGGCGWALAAAAAAAGRARGRLLRPYDGGMAVPVAASLSAPYGPLDPTRHQRPRWASRSGYRRRALVPWRGGAASSGRPSWCRPLSPSAIRWSGSCAKRDAVDGGQRRVVVAAPCPRAVAVRGSPPSPPAAWGAATAGVVRYWLPSPLPLPASTGCPGLSPPARGWCGWRWAWRRRVEWYWAPLLPIDGSRSGGGRVGGDVGGAASLDPGALIHALAFVGLGSWRGWSPCGVLTLNGRPRRRRARHQRWTQRRCPLLPQWS